jgi:hypothetical protein
MRGRMSFVCGQSLDAVAHAYKGGGQGRGYTSAATHTAHAHWDDSRMLTSAHPPSASLTQGPATGPDNSSSRNGMISSHSALGPTRQSMSARFEAVHHKSLSLARLGEKHSKIYANAADEKAQHTLETLPYALPPAACLMLAVVLVGVYAVKRSQSIPSGRSHYARQCEAARSAHAYYESRLIDEQRASAAPMRRVAVSSVASGARHARRRLPGAHNLMYVSCSSCHMCAR